VRRTLGNRRRDACVIGVFNRVIAHAPELMAMPE